MDDPVFVHDEPHIDDDEDDSYEDNSRYDTPDRSRIEETLFTELPAVRLKQTQNPRLLRECIIDLYRHLDVDLVNTDLFKVDKKSERSGAVEFYAKKYNESGKTWVRLTNMQRTGKFASKNYIARTSVVALIR